MKTTLKKPLGLIPLQQWMDEQQAWYEESLWIRDNVYYMAARALASRNSTPLFVPMSDALTVHGTHVTRSIKLPVYRIDIRGFTIKIRYNSHDWCVRIWGSDGVVLPEYLAEACDSIDGQYEGMEDTFDTTPPTHQFCIGGKDKMYAILWHILEECRKKADAEDAPGYEATMRRQGWMLTSELWDDPEPHVVTAMRATHESNWDEFEEDVKYNSTLVLFNPDHRRFSHAMCWEDLAVMEGVKLQNNDVASE